VDRFPEEAIIRYNLACYECQLGRLTDAKEWLRKAFDLGNSEQFKLMALGGRDLSRSASRSGACEAPRHPGCSVMAAIVSRALPSSRLLT
jgi:hypothetical protein